MSAPTLISEELVVAEPLAEDTPAIIGSRIPRHVARQVAAGTSALALGVFIERGSGLLANILAARLGGTAIFGAYSLAFSTANNISTYAAGGIGATATRFSGKYPFESRGYVTLARVLALISTVSAATAVIALWAGAPAIAQLLHKPALSSLLRWASLSAGGMIVLECARGFFVGQRRLRGLVLLSSIVGIGMLALLPVAAWMHQPIRMILAQGGVTIFAVALCLLCARPLGLRPPASANTGLPFLAMLREVWSFGFIQLTGLIASNLAGWWLTALIARADTTLVQMSFFAVASQMRNLAGLGPSLLTEGSYASIASPEYRTPHHVMAACTFVSTALVLLLACVGTILAPQGLRLIYGKAYPSASVAVAAALSIAVVHMGNAPAAARLSVVSIKTTGIINTIWAVAIAVAGTLLFARGGNAALAMGIYFGAHALSAALVLLILKKIDYVPAGMAPLFLLSTVTAFTLTLFAALRQLDSAHTWPLSIAMGVLSTLSMATLAALGKRHGWMPTLEAVRVGVRKLASMVGFETREHATGRANDFK
ncbi:oligosaccharide flippase family protein [Silvibacterium sp.]|uniref:oligosaccharide flippase family protein n=1 Tax=Silvibacterium sp. TaxID=1964179 RepID=UPI0039E32935